MTDLMLDGIYDHLESFCFLRDAVFLHTNRIPFILHSMYNLVKLHTRGYNHG